MNPYHLRGNCCQLKQIFLGGGSMKINDLISGKLNVRVPLGIQKELDR